VARALSNPSWKVIVSASRGQYLKPGSFEPGFFFALMGTALILRSRALFARRLEGWKGWPVWPILRDATHRTAQVRCRESVAPQDEGRPFSR
jgi:hypothetical protein